MSLLLTADHHFRLHWFRWLIQQAPKFDLVCIAGDLLDMFSSETRMEQAREIRTLLRELADIVPVAICSGKVDNALIVMATEGATQHGINPLSGLTMRGVR